MPTIGELQYSLGLVLAEEKHIDEAGAALAKAAKLLPGARGFTTTSGWRCSSWGAASRLKPRCCRRRTSNLATCYALAVLCAQGERYAQALPWAEKVLALVRRRGN
jgi:hypothetical protein